MVRAAITLVRAECLKVILGTQNYHLNKVLWPFLQTEVHSCHIEEKGYHVGGVEINW